MTIPSRQFLIQQAVLCAMEEQRDTLACLLAQKKTLPQSFLIVHSLFPEGATMLTLVDRTTTHFQRLLAEAQAREIAL